MITYKGNSFAETKPLAGENVFIAKGANVIGTVNIGKSSCIGHKALVRADGNTITIGEDAVISDLAVVHVAGVFSAAIGDYTIISARSIVHGAHVGRFCYIADNAKILDGSTVGDFSIVSAGAVVAKGTIVPPYSLVEGIPGKISGKVDFDEKAHKERVSTMKKMLCEG